MRLTENAPLLRYPHSSEFVRAAQANTRGAGSRFREALHMGVFRQPPQKKVVRLTLMSDSQ
jgi:hypothetical protein